MTLLHSMLPNKVENNLRCILPTEHWHAQVHQNQPVGLEATLPRFCEATLLHVDRNLAVAGIVFVDLKMSFNHAFDRNDLEFGIIYNQYSRLAVAICLTLGTA